MLKSFFKVHFNAQLKILRYSCRQFLSLSLFICLFGFVCMSKANTNLQCSSFFNEDRKLSHLATMEVLKENSSEESYLKYRAGYEKK